VNGQTYTVICDGVCRAIPIDEDPPPGCTFGVCVVEPPALKNWWIVFLILILFFAAGVIAKSK
jgi:hypothetical protein